jgi:predicted nucleic acid-binding protein
VTSNLVVAEVHQLLLRRAGIRPARAAIARIATPTAVTLVFPQPETEAGARRWLDRFDDRALSYTDAVSFALIESNRCAFALTFDGDFELAGFEIWSG